MPTAHTDFLDRLGISVPIMQAPMGGGPSTPELAAAVSNAGGMGWLGAAYQTPQQIAEDVRRIRELTDKPFGINLFAGGYQTPAQIHAEPMISLMSEVHETLHLPPPVLPPFPSDPFPEQFNAVLAAKPKAFSFVFGIPSFSDIERLKSAGILIVGTATTVAEAGKLREAGVDAIAAQGGQAGGHRSTFLGSVEESLIPTLDLTREISQTLPLPVIAAGGLMDGRDIAKALAHGASAASLGTAFLVCPESGASEAYRRAILAASIDTTVITRAFSGRAARGLTNTFIEKLAGKETAILPYPLQNAFTRPMRTAAAKQGEAGYLSLWAGQGVARARSLPAMELMQRLIEELRSVK